MTVMAVNPSFNRPVSSPDFVFQGSGRHPPGEYEKCGGVKRATGMEANGAFLVVEDEWELAEATVTTFRSPRSGRHQVVHRRAAP
jgi:hypothetical protein